MPLRAQEQGKKARRRVEPSILESCYYSNRNLSPVVRYNSLARRAQLDYSAPKFSIVARAGRTPSAESGEPTLRPAGGS